MNTCYSGHPEIVFATPICPLCEMEADKDEAIYKLHGQLVSLQAEIESLKKQLIKIP